MNKFFKDVADILNFRKAIKEGAEGHSATSGGAELTDGILEDAWDAFKLEQEEKKICIEQLEDALIVEEEFKTAYAAGWKEGQPKPMTAREFLEYAGYEDNEKNLYALTQYIAGNIDFSQFPDAEAMTQDGTPLNEGLDEPAAFQEWMDRQ